MSELGKPQGLVKRKGSANWYFRLRVPADLVARFGFAEKWVSLGTAQYEAALKALSEQRATWEAAFSQARREAASPEQPQPEPSRANAPSASFADAVRLAQTFFRRELAQLDEGTTTRLDFSPEEAEAIDEEFGLVAADFLHPEAPDGLRKTFNASEALLRDAGLSADPRTAGQLQRLVARAMLQLVAIERSRFSGDYSDRVTDSAFARGSTPMAAVAHSQPLLSLEDAAVRFRREVIELRQPTAKTAAKQRATLDHVIGFFGPGRALTSIERTECIALRDLVSKLPPNFTKQFPGRSLSDIAAANEDGTLGQMAYDTQATYVGMMSRFFAWASDERLIANDIARGLPPRAKKVPREDQRDPFTPAELRAIFDAPLYRGCVDDEQGYSTPGPNHPRRSRFWLPLLALFTGMRVGEILQLGPDDVRVSDRGIHFILLHRGMQLKTQNARREIPIHSELKRIGFLEFVESQRTAGARMLFDDVPPGSDGYASSVFSKRFASFAKSVWVKKESGEQVFHSFRHNFRDALREAGVAEEHAEALAGWSRGKRQSRGYGRGHSADALNGELQRVRYEGLDLSHLYD